MVSGLIALGVLLIVASAPEKAEPPCVGQARELFSKVRDLSVKGRARMIELAVRRDVGVVCGVVEQSFFTKEPELPSGCDRRSPLGCGALRIVSVSKSLEGVIDPVVYVRVQTIARLLREKSLLSAPHKALLEIWLASAALARQADQEHGH